MIKIFLCEDNEAQLNFYEKLIENMIVEYRYNAKIIAAKSNPYELLQTMEKGTDSILCFLDVNFGGHEMDGFALGMEIRAINTEATLVFLATEDFLAYKTFEYQLNAMDYIVKDPDCFLDAEKRTKLEYRFRQIFEKLQKCHGALQADAVLKIEGGSRIINVNLGDIICIQAIKGKHQQEISTKNRKFTIGQSLKKIKEHLDEHFIFCNKSCIINLNKVLELDSRGKLIFLEGNLRYEVSIRELPKVKALVKGRENR